MKNNLTLLLTPAKLIRLESILKFPPPGLCLTFDNDPIFDLIGPRRSDEDAIDIDASSDSIIDCDERTDSDFLLNLNFF